MLYPSNNQANASSPKTTQTHRFWFLGYRVTSTNNTPRITEQTNLPLEQPSKQTGYGFGARTCMNCEMASMQSAAHTRFRGSTSPFPSTFSCVICPPTLSRSQSRGQSLGQSRGQSTLLGAHASRTMHPFLGRGKQRFNILSSEGGALPSLPPPLPVCAQPCASGQPQWSPHDCGT